MSTFLNMLAVQDKSKELVSTINKIRAKVNVSNVFELDLNYFSATEDCALLYSMPASLYKFAVERNTLSKLKVEVRQGVGASTKFHRLWWEIPQSSLSLDGGRRWPFMAHGTPYAPFYKSSYFVFKWGRNGEEAKADVLHKYPYLKGNYGFKIQSEDFFFQSGLCYGKRTTNFSVQVMPENHIFSQEGTAISFTKSSIDPWALLGIMNSKVVSYWLSQVCAQHKVYNYVQSTPMPHTISDRLAVLSRDAWGILRKLDTTNETGNVFILPESLIKRKIEFNRELLEKKIVSIIEEIDRISFDLYELQQEDIEIIQNGGVQFSEETCRQDDEEEYEDDDGVDGVANNTISPLLSWGFGVAFGRFDWRLATGEREIPPETNPFDPLPAKSPGMLPDGAEPFHTHNGILVEDQGHPHDLAHIVEDLFARIDITVPDNIRHWIPRNFFTLHLLHYSKSRRKAPIYWPISTTSGNYTLWFYYHSLTSQTLYSAINDFIDPKLTQVGDDVMTLRNKGSARTRDDEKQLEALQAFELELIQLRETLLKLAPTYKPNHDDGVQICAAPLWQLFRHKPWQKVLQDTWAKLEKGDFDWAHLAMNYWPERVREKCKTDKSLAIAHGLEHLYIEPEAKPKKTRGRKKAGGDE